MHTHKIYNLTTKERSDNVKKHYYIQKLLFKKKPDLK